MVQIDGQAFLMIQCVVYGFAKRRLRRCLRLDRFQPHEESLQLVFFKPQTFLLPVSYGQLCQVFIQREQLINPFERLPADGIGNLVLVQSWRDCPHEVPAAMDPAECMLLAGNLLISAIAIRLKDSMESFEEICGKTAASALMILIDADLMIWLVLAIGEHPHVRLCGVLPFFLIEHLNRSLIRMND